MGKFHHCGNYLKINLKIIDFLICAYFSIFEENFADCWDDFRAMTEDKENHNAHGDACQAEFSKSQRLMTLYGDDDTIKVIELNQQSNKHPTCSVKRF